MKKLLCVLGVCLVAGCQVQPGLTLSREHDAAGVPTNNYRVLTASGHTQAQGQLVAGRMEGRWTFFDSFVKVAEVTYQMGVPTGPYRTYFGGVAFPASAGKLQSVGQLRNGRVVGRCRGYDRLTGQVVSDAVFDAQGMAHPAMGSSNLAERFAQNDARFVQFLDTVARKVTEHPPEPPTASHLAKLARQHSE